MKIEKIALIVGIIAALVSIAVNLPTLLKRKA